MRTWPTNSRKKSRIEIIPMIDVMMFLLVFFVLISLNVIPAMGIKTQLPASSQAQSLRSPTRQVVVTLGKDGKVVVNGQTVELGAVLPTVKAIPRHGEKLVVVINSDKGAEVQLLVDVMDELKSGGVESVSVAARDKR